MPHERHCQDFTVAHAGTPSLLAFLKRRNIKLGLVSNLAGRVPVRGELVEGPDGWEFEILDADPRRIKRIRVRPTEASAGDVAEQQTG